MKKNSNRKTVIQQAHATTGNPWSKYASTIPTHKDAMPAICEFVACTIAGNVMTASVTYGT